MPIRLLILSLLVLCLAVSGCQQTQEPAVKVGVVDMNRLLRDSEPGKEASRFLEGMQKEIQQQIDDVQARLGKDPENENLQRELQAIYMGGQQRINAEQQNVVSQLLDLTQRLVNNYRKANGLSVVLGTDVAVAYDPALDVTNALLRDEQAEGQLRVREQPPARSSRRGGCSCRRSARPCRPGRQGRRKARCRKGRSLRSQGPVAAVCVILREPRSLRGSFRLFPPASRTYARPEGTLRTP